MGDIDFWRINMRPGKPLAFGSLQGVPFFGLPGNPVSSMVTFEVFLRPVLARLAGRKLQRKHVNVQLEESIESDGRRSYVRVTLRRDGERLIALPTGAQSSGALMSMVLAQGLAIVPEGIRQMPAGAEVKALLLREIE